MEYTKDTPKRIVRSENGEITYLVEWRCPECEGKGCKACRRSGVMDGPAYAFWCEGPRFRDQRSGNGKKAKK